MRSILLILLMILPAAAPQAGEREWLGRARLFTNDKLGDGQDRWRTGSYSLSAIRGQSWDGHLPAGLGDLVEYRIRTAIIAPDDLSNPVLGTDRRYAAAIHFGAISHFRRGALDIALGLDMVVTGPQTGLGDFQSWVHGGLGLGQIQVLGSQIGNALYPTLVAEVSREFVLAAPGGRRTTFRPFLEAQAGVETLARIGADFTFGPAGEGDFMVRDVGTGQRSTAMKGNRTRGVTFVLGGDIAYVADSAFLPRASGFGLTPARVRLRGGVLVEEGQRSLFYGLTWLGREFVNQPEGQVVGSVAIRMRF
ncbi:MAG: lipid A deacylase LpxR family protein [Rhodobacteraceae bacterium]|nr:lipid A deacylase LpxR family protein [Paracoccaceae bacterium]MCB1366382.1 DUF2219 family protein [Paracoccaceae bacterium]